MEDETHVVAFADNNVPFRCYRLGNPYAYHYCNRRLATSEAA